MEERQCYVCEDFLREKKYRPIQWKRENPVCVDCQNLGRVYTEYSRVPMEYGEKKLVDCLGYCGKKFYTRLNRRVCYSCRLRQSLIGDTAGH